MTTVSPQPSNAATLRASGSVRPGRIFALDLERFVIAALKAAGVREADAQTTATVLVTTDTWGVFTHGVKNLPGYVRRLRAGGLRGDATPTIDRQGPGWAIINGQNALGMVGSTMAMGVAIEKAGATGMGYAGLHNGCHFGAAGYYALMAAEQGLVGLAMANDTPSMNVPGARGRIMGNNPFAFAAPAGKEKPIFLDMALSTVAGGKVMAAHTLGKTIPNNWVVDKNGIHTTNPADFLQNGGALQPMAGHKGYGLALMVETFSSLLTGAAVRSDVGSWLMDDAATPTGHGAAFMAVDVAAMISPEVFAAKMDRMIRDIRGSELAAGAERIYLPGEIEWDRRAQSLAHGIELPPDVVLAIQTLSQELNVPVTGLVLE